MKADTKEQARVLRKEGKSVGKIAKELDVSKSTVSLWCRDLPVITTYIGDCKKAIAVKVERCKELRFKAQQAGREFAKNNDLFRLGCMLYWAEGSKSKNSITFTNSDPDMMAFFMKFLREALGVDNKRITVYCNCFDDIKSVDEIQDFWLDRLSLLKESLRKTTVNAYSSASKKVAKKLEYGTCRVCVHDTLLLNTIYGGIQETAGFITDKWN